jgi:2-polyprenyl-6-methoxyphenol hydroxylase-like FAD-dependent oxidoreductase
LRNVRDRGCCSRVTVIGDACHPMSMFKGQGF